MGLVYYRRVPVHAMRQVCCWTATLTCAALFTDFWYHFGSIHRKIGIHISRIKSLKLDNWEQAHVTTMEEQGNRKINEHFEKNVPPYYRRPNPNDPQ